MLDDAGITHLDGYLRTHRGSSLCLPQLTCAVRVLPCKSISETEILNTQNPYILILQDFVETTRTMELGFNAQDRDHLKRAM